MPADPVGLPNLSVPFQPTTTTTTTTTAEPMRPPCLPPRPLPSSSTSSSSAAPVCATPALPVFAAASSSPLSPPYPGSFDFPSAPSAPAAFSLTDFTDPAPAPPLFLHVDTAEGVTPRLPTADEQDFDALRASVVTVLDDQPAHPAPDLVLPMSMSLDHTVYQHHHHPSVKESPTLAVIDAHVQTLHVGDTRPAADHPPAPAPAADALVLSQQRAQAQTSRAARTARRRAAPPNAGATAAPPRAARGVRAPPPKQEELLVPEPWADMEEINHLVAVVGPVPVDVVDLLYKKVYRRAEANARGKKLQLREQLKKKATEEFGSAAEISSRREAKVSRRYQIELRTAVEDQLKESLRQNALLWTVFKRVRESLEVAGQGDESPSAKRQRMDD